MNWAVEADLGTNLEDLAKRMNSGTNLGDFAERVNSGTNLGDLAERMKSGTNLGDLVERVNSGTNLTNLAKRVNSGTNLRDLAERANSGTNLGDIAERTNSGINHGDLVERANSGTNLGDLAERANSGTSLGDLAESANSGANLGDLTEGANLGATTGPNWGFRLDWSAHPIGNVPPYVSEEESVLVGRLKGILSSLYAIKEMTELWLVEAGLSPTSKGGSQSHSKGKEPAVPVEELETPVESTKEAMTPVFHRPKSMKDLCETKVRKDDAGYYALYMSNLAHQDPDKEMQARWEKLRNLTKIWNNLSAVEEFERGLMHSQLARELYTLPSEVLLVRAAKEMVLMVLFDRVHDAGQLITFMDYRITSLQQEINALKSGGGPEAVAAAEEHASELEKELEKIGVSKIRRSNGVKHLTKN
ncbi:hypothetical protein BHE74_00024960 [Ensete ventricosum]|nr:hypothetical protein BHE74_00024960 [Ensete ventricosum]